ncbi:hypothetical protein Dtox_3634 [Desulfofarcimen acetoxidans DSM 771]|jgi:methyl-accepting chemotaxis protein|uniref:Methyl-accepting chemotaxis sensory transducer n=1 Tax=Desulfofarcimen acetoxidans (strain ATCC 49208 / DSM 771 / KCTC 5769 / VKM B-1644 / 5575) TaxID=485916 RepID=C8VWI2_DESAS|nr:hypothetical protein [Desulfofarcimen acetoxidans]ACV64346.1 hypothetical protein Dtox_3634 [Desulfofarcimen acetoxidans DSM 771]
MNHQTNPFLQHVARHGQRLLGESNKAVSVSNALISACDEILFSLNSGNMQSAANAAHHARNMASQVAASSQELNQAINERMEMASHVLSKVQHRVNELSSVLQSIRSSDYNYGNTTGACCHGSSIQYQPGSVYTS